MFSVHLCRMVVSISRHYKPNHSALKCMNYFSVCIVKAVVYILLILLIHIDLLSSISTPGKTISGKLWRRLLFIYIISPISQRDRQRPYCHLPRSLHTSFASSTFNFLIVIAPTTVN